jgi:uncharacterized membrane protein/nitrite reductase/ring-hydroxylating ferredoxin subunit
MKSRASLKGHPIHPMLVSFPIALLTASFLFDVLGLILEDDHLHIAALYMQVAGIFMGLVAAVPGLIDYSSTVPPESSAKKRAAKHGILNSLILLLFGAVLYLRHQPPVDFRVLIAMELLGVIGLGFSGWMGATLVYRNQIGVNPRYAGAGKWKEKYLSEEADLEVGDTSELKLNQMMLIHAGNRRIVIAHTEQGFVAFDDRCTHRGGSLAGGAMICGTVQCPWHGSQFDVTTGQVKAGPAEQPIKTYVLQVRNGKLFLVT